MLNFLSRRWNAEKKSKGWNANKMYMLVKFIDSANQLEPDKYEGLYPGMRPNKYEGLSAAVLGIYFGTNFAEKYPSDRVEALKAAEKLTDRQFENFLLSLEYPCITLVCRKLVRGWNLKT